MLYRHNNNMILAITIGGAKTVKLLLLCSPILSLVIKRYVLYTEV